jgi:hypothetical protein
VYFSRRESYNQLRKLIRIARPLRSLHRFGIAQRYTSSIGAETMRPTRTWWMKRHDTVNYVILGVVLSFTVWTALFPSPVPNWAVIGFVFVVLLPMAIVLTVKRMRLESSLARRLWQALTRG